MKQNIKDLIIFIGIIALILLSFFRGDEKPVNSDSEVKIKVVEKIIEGKDSTIYKYTTKIIHETKHINRLTKSVDSLKFQLSHLKDTTEIIKLQSVLIDTLTQENIHLKTVVKVQDSVNTQLKQVVALKDTIIGYKDEIIIDLKDDNKKTKRKLIGSIGLNIAQSIALIFKK